MLDIKFIRENPEIVKDALKKRNFKLFSKDEKDKEYIRRLKDSNHPSAKTLEEMYDDPGKLIDLILQVHTVEIEQQKAIEDKKSELNKINKEIGLRKSKKEDASDLMEKAQDLKKQLQFISQTPDDVAEMKNFYDKTLTLIPNIPHESVPIGKDESENVELRKWGKPKTFDFKIKDHEELGTELDILDFERSAKISGSRFVVLWGLAAKLERALVSFMLDIQTKEHDYKEVYPPYLVNEETAYGTGQLPKFEEDLYKTKLDDMYLISTAEIPVTNLHAKEMLKGDELPLNYCAYTTCFRREAGSYGKDTKGMLRVHQFNKVELVKFVKPEDSYNELEILTSHAEKILQLLELPYRVVTLCTGDLGFSAAKTYDLEVWIPSQEKYREVSSCSNFEDFQARRASIRFKREPKSKPEFVHTLNGSGLAIGRTMIAIMENYQNADGSINIPRVLRRYMDDLDIIKKPD